MSKQYAIFDMDFTVIPYDSLMVFCNHMIRKSRWRMIFLFIFLPVVPLKIIKLVSTKTMKRFFLSFLMGVDEKVLRKEAKDFGNYVYENLFYTEMKEVIKKEKKAGRILILTTASPDIYVEQIAKRAGFDYYRATKLIVRGKMPLIPEIEGENNKSFVKLETMKDILKTDLKIGSDGFGKPIPKSNSYSDSIADLPILRLGANAYLVHPVSQRLIEEANQKAWHILKPKRPYEKRSTLLLHSLLQVLGLYS